MFKFKVTDGVGEVRGIFPLLSDARWFAIDASVRDEMGAFFVTEIGTGGQVDRYVNGQGSRAAVLALKS